jgi:hypothetical protein
MALEEPRACSFKLGRRVVYLRVDVKQWVEEQRRATTRGSDRILFLRADLL